jgi:hypothetical protein
MPDHLPTTCDMLSQRVPTAGATQPPSYKDTNGEMKCSEEDEEEEKAWDDGPNLEDFE